MPNYRFIIYLINGKYKFIHFQCERSFASLLDICLFSIHIPIFLSIYCSVVVLSVCTITLTIPPKSPSSHPAPIRTLLSTAWCRYAYVSHIHTYRTHATLVYGLRFVPRPVHKKCAICCCCFYRKLCLVGFHI